MPSHMVPSMVGSMIQQFVFGGMSCLISSAHILVILMAAKCCLYGDPAFPIKPYPYARPTAKPAQQSWNKQANGVCVVVEL